MIKFTYLLPLLCCISIIVVNSYTVEAIEEENDNDESNINNLISWIRDKGGIINAKIEIKKTHDQQNSLSHYSMFAKNYIPEKELLLRIPPDCIFAVGLPTIGDEVFVVSNTLNKHEPHEGSTFSPAIITKINDDLTYDLNDEENDEELLNIESHYIYTKHTKMDGITMNESIQCNVARNLINEMKVGSESTHFSPFMDYLSSQQQQEKTKVVVPPSKWSNDGKSLLLDILDNNKLPPYDIKTKWESECKDFDNTNNFSTPPSYKNLYIPIVSDIINHRTAGSHAVNTEYEIDTNGFTIRSSRGIDSNDEIFSTYNFCNDCDKYDIDYGTPHVFRDYGIIESYPQKWYFEKEGIGFEIYESKTSPTTPTTTNKHTANDAIDMVSNSKQYTIRWIKTNSKDDVTKLKLQLDRLIQLEKNEILQSCPKNIPENEFLAISQYISSLITALKNALITTPKLECYDNYDFAQYIDMEIIQTPYQVMTFKYNPYKNNDVCLHLGGIGLDRSTDILQQCTKYRPHYHEMFVHYSARFITDSSIKRVIWVGGGDSMLLHEIIKYPSLEFAVGLEIDQTVTRKSFQYFGTQPHWDNEKVQWWYGDAAKSLLVIPKEWYGTFDLVLVDLSETVLSLSVCDKLDILSALGLLLKPNGVLVKNDEYFNKLSTVFNHTLQLEFDISVPVPTLCSQPVIYASNKKFDVRSSSSYIDHNVDVLWDRHIPPLDNSTDKNDNNSITDIMTPWYTYRSNDIKPDTCKARLEIEQELQRNDKSPGILMILEAENINNSVLLKQPTSLVSNIENMLEDNNLNLIQSTIHTNDNDDVQIMTLFNQGYIITRTWINYNYVAFDIHLWGNFDKHETIKKSLLSIVKSDNPSSYRIVAGGMFGLKSWDDDMKKRGPRFTQTCINTEKTPINGFIIKNENPVEQSFVDYVLEQMISLRDNDDSNKKLNVVVFCGDASEECTSMNVLQNNDKLNKILEVAECNDVATVQECMKSVGKHLSDFVKLVDTDQSDDDVHPNYFAIGDRVSSWLGNLGRAYFGTINYIGRDGLEIIYDNGKRDIDLEIASVHHITKMDILQEEMKVDLFVIDPNVSMQMAEIIRYILMEEEMRENVSANHTLTIALTPFENLNRMNLLQRLQLNMTQTNHAVVYAQVYFHHSEDILDMSLISSGDQLFLERLQDFLAELEQGKVFNFTSDIEKMYRNEVVLETTMAESFSAQDYNTTSSYEQWQSQMSLGRQTLFQLEKFSMTSRILNDADPISINYSVEVYVSEDDAWYAGAITAIDEEDDTYEVYTVNEFFVSDLDRDSLRMSFYTPLDHVPMSKVDVHNALLITCNDLPGEEPLEFTDFGDGSLHSFHWNGGSLLVLWNGKNHVDINLFTYDETKDFHDTFVHKFTKEIPCLSVALHDTQPRGVGRVVNFKNDVESRPEPIWVAPIE